MGCIFMNIEFSNPEMGEMCWQKAEKKIMDDGCWRMKKQNIFSPGWDKVNN